MDVCFREESADVTRKQCYQLNTLSAVKFQTARVSVILDKSIHHANRSNHFICPYVKWGRVIVHKRKQDTPSAVSSVYVRLYQSHTKDTTCMCISIVLL